MNVAVTGVGGGVGQSILKALQDTDYTTIGIDSEVLGTGLYATKKSYLGLYANHPHYVDKIIEICKKEDCEIIFPGLDIELIYLSKNIKKLKTKGITPIVSTPKVIKISDDKLETSKFLKQYNLPYIETYRLKEYDFNLDFPVILKPQKGGARSIGVFLVKNKREFRKYCSDIKFNNYIVQEYLPGEEYTCGSISFEGGCIGTIVMRRQLRNGDTYKAFVIKDEDISDFVKNVINILKPFGACNIQLKIKDNECYIFEINARCSGTTASRALAGFNEPKMICDYFFKGIHAPHYQIEEIAILRYWKELLVTNDKINEIKSNGFISNDKVIL